MIKPFFSPPKATEKHGADYFLPFRLEAIYLWKTSKHARSPRLAALDQIFHASAGPVPVLCSYFFTLYLHYTTVVNPSSSADMKEVLRRDAAMVGFFSGFYAIGALVCRPAAGINLSICTVAAMWKTAVISLWRPDLTHGRLWS